MQKFVCQPTEPGRFFPYCVAMFDPRKNKNVPLNGEEYPTYEEAEKRASELNKEDQQEFDEKNQQEFDEMTEDNRLSPKTKHMIETLEKKWNEIDKKI